MMNPINAANEAATKSGADLRRFIVDCDGGSYGFTNAFAFVGERWNSRGRAVKSSNCPKSVTPAQFSGYPFGSSNIWVQPCSRHIAK